ncbi:MAG: hypothetical protein JW819_03955 [Candidatus Krumholzibacteriota bacterium]|nr:hypothetical protein [Candidatus Krumholzibacteriota bacterium]
MKRLLAGIEMPRGLRLAQLAVVVAWLAVFAWLAAAGLARVRENRALVAQLDARLEALGVWTAITPPEREAASRWKDAILARFDTRFPPERGLERLFLSLAEAARQSGVDPIQVQVAPEPLETLVNRRTTASLYVEEPPLAEELEALGVEPPRLDGGRLVAHRLELRFASEYGQLAVFLHELRRVERAVVVRRLQILPGRQEDISVTMELEFYVQTEA